MVCFSALRNFKESNNPQHYSYYLKDYVIKYVNCYFNNPAYIKMRC
jgi:hypothetical protein